MIVPVFDMWTIFLVTLFDVILDLFIFKLFKVRSVTVIFTLFMDFFIPSLAFQFYIMSKPPLDQQVSALADYIGNIMVNLVNYTISAIFAYIITAVIYIATLGRTEKPELDF